MGSFVDSGHVTAAEEECRELSSDMRPAGRKKRALVRAELGSVMVYN